MEKKYKLTKENISYFSRTLYRIEALKDFGNVKKGDKGGYVESEYNLSQEGDCWIFDNAKVYGYAEVYNDALVFDNAEVYGNAKVYCNAKVYGKALVYGYVEVYGNTEVYDNALVFGNAEVWGNAKVYGKALVYNNAFVYDNALIFGNAYVSDNAEVFGKAKVFGNAKVSDSAKVYNDAQVSGNAEICSDAEIKNSSDYIVFKNWWSSGRYFTWTRSNNMWKVGCFYGTGEKLIKKAYKDSELSGREYKRVVNYMEFIESIYKNNTKN